MTPIRLPNFFIAGAPNTGTTSLYFYLRQHPQIYMSPVKEPLYFGATEFVVERDGGWEARAARRRTLRWKLRRLVKRSGVVLSWDDYVKLFRGARDEPAVGEATPQYFILPGAARAIGDRIPHAKLIFIIRDPADWLLTRYLAKFWPDPGSSFRERFRAAMRPDDIWAPALKVGRYATNLQRFFDAFPRDQLQVHLYEDFRRDGRDVLRRILTFLGVDPDYPIDTSYQHNVTVVPRFPVMHRLRERLIGDIPVLHWFPASVRRAFRRFYNRARPPLVMDPADREIVIDYYRGEIQGVANLIGRDLSAWLR